MSLILRHDPGSVGLELDPHGWVGVDALVAALCASGKLVRSVDIERVVETSDKQRFELSAGRIRAAQGHSVQVELGLTPTDPPEVLWHGTVERFLDSITSDGLLPSGRQFVHLSASVETALNVGSRRGDPVLLKVLAGKLGASGASFFQASNGVWLVDSVPSEFLELHK